MLLLFLALISNTTLFSLDHFNKIAPIKYFFSLIIPNIYDITNALMILFLNGISLKYATSLGSFVFKEYCKFLSDGPVIWWIAKSTKYIPYFKTI